MNDMKFTIINDEGQEIVCEVLFTYQDDNTGKSYIVYTDNTLDEDGCTKVYASILVEDDDDPQLLPIETEAEWMIIEQIMEDLQNEITNEDG